MWLLEVDSAALERGFGVIEGNYAKTVAKGRMSAEEAEARRARIQGTTDYADLADVDMVIEAVFENMAVKKIVI